MSRSPGAVDRFVPHAAMVRPQSAAALSIQSATAAASLRTPRRAS